MKHLLKRIEVSPEAAYKDFCRQDELLKGNQIRTMSKLTRRIMASIDYNLIKTKRRDNYMLLETALSDKNGISLPLANDAVPMVYPYLSTEPALRQRLIDNKIYVATYWPNVVDWCNGSSNDNHLTKYILPLPIDQRYGKEEMNTIVQIITKWI